MLDQLIESANDTARKARAAWITMMSVAIYLAVVVASTTHRDLLLVTPQTLPFLGVELPLFVVYWVAPAAMLLLHLNVLVQLATLGARLREIEGEIAAQAPDHSPNWPRRQRARLDSFVYVISFVGDRMTAWKFFAHMITWVTIVAMPVALLLGIQLRFLPYHDPFTTWWHRVAFLADLVLIWILWHDSAAPRAHIRWIDRPVGLTWRLITTGLAVLFSWVIATVPDEWIERMAATVTAGGTLALAEGLESLRLEDPSGDLVLENPLQRNIRVERTQLIEEDRLREITESRFADDLFTIDLSGRDLRNAVLFGVDLRKANLRGTKLDNAALAQSILTDSDLSGASLVDATLYGIDLVRADLTGADLTDADLREGDLSETRLVRTRLDNADLRNIVLNGADAGQAIVRGANLADASILGATMTETLFSGSILSRVDLRSTSLVGAKLDETTLRDANLVGVDLSQANLQSADLRGVDLTGSMLREADFSAANMAGAVMLAADARDIVGYGADFTAAQLDAADLSNATLKAADFSGARLRGTRFSDAIVTAARFDDAQVWRAVPPPIANTVATSFAGLRYVPDAGTAEEEAETPERGAATVLNRLERQSMIALPRPGLGELRGEAGKRIRFRIREIDAAQESAFRAGWERLADRPPISLNERAAAISAVVCGLDSPVILASRVIQTLQVNVAQQAEIREDQRAIARALLSDDCDKSSGLSEQQREGLRAIVGE